MEEEAVTARARARSDPGTLVEASSDTYVGLPIGTCVDRGFDIGIDPGFDMSLDPPIDTLPMNKC